MAAIAANRTELLMVHPEGGRVIETRGRLVFHRHGTRSDLTQIRVPGTSFYSELVDPQPNPRPNWHRRIARKPTPSKSQ